MKSTEVRLNNWVFDELDTKVRQIEPLDFFSDTFKYLTPIPLDEQWLIKFGFKKWIYCDDCAYIKFGGKYLFFRKCKGKWIGYITRIKNEGADNPITSASKYTLKVVPQYVHKLQNFIYELTGKELTLNK